MSNFMKSGLRQMKVAEDKKVKKHIKGFYSIIGKIDEISNMLDPTIKYTEENINEYTYPHINRDLDDMEKFLILGKMYRENETINNIEVKHEAKDNI